MAEPFSDHEIKSICCTGVGLGTQWVFGHNLGDLDISGFNSSPNHTKGQIFGSEDTSNAIVIIGNENTILSLSCHQHRSIRYCSIGLDLERRAWLERQDRAWRRFASMANSSG